MNENFKILHTEFVRRYEEESDRNKSLEAKTSTLISVMGLIFGLVLIGFSIIYKEGSKNIMHNIFLIVSVIVGIIFIFAFIYGRKVFNLVEYKLALDPEPFWEEFAEADIDVTLEQIIGNLAHSIIHNEEINNQKAEWVDYVIKLSFVGLILLPVLFFTLVLSLLWSGVI